MNLLQAAQNTRAGQTVTMRPSGHSMTPIIQHRQQVSIAPVSAETELRRGSVVLVKVKGKWLLHRIAKLSAEQYEIANAKGRVNGLVRREAIAGVVTEIHTL